MPAAPELLIITTSELQLQKNNALVETVEQKERLKIMSKLSISFICLSEI